MSPPIPNPHIIFPLTRKTVSGPFIAATGTSNIYAFQINGTGWGSWENSVLLGTTAPAAGVPNAVNVGYVLGTQSPTFARFTHAVYAEVIGISDATTQKRLTVEGYLAWKWGLVASLSASHPFRNRPPLIGD